MGRGLNAYIERYGQPRKASTGVRLSPDGNGSWTYTGEVPESPKDDIAFLTKKLQEGGGDFDFGSARAILKAARETRGSGDTRTAAQRSPREEATQVGQVPGDVVAQAPAPPVNQFGDPNRPGAFAGSYFDYLGTGSPSDPRNFYMEGAPGPYGVGLGRYEGPIRTGGFGTPAGMPSFLSDGPESSFYETESEYQERTRPGFGEVLGDAGKSAAGAFLDSVLADLLGGIRQAIQ
jgi:hypothetical protein